MTGTYSYVGAGPHAVTSIGSMTFSYDANGNMTSRDGAAIGWTSFNKPEHIAHSNGDYADFTYGPDRSRWIQEAEDGTWVYTRHYGGPGFEVLMWDTSDRVDTHYIFANGEAVAQWTTSNVDADLLQYLHRDHQGSVVATTDDQGSVLAEFEYDAFGARTVLTGSEDLSHRGYTGHEHLAPVEMIHMNGRVQDPVLGRFLSPDPNVPYPFDSQSFNRYSYVRNNPLKRIDPSGFGDLDNCVGYACIDLEFVREATTLQSLLRYGTCLGAFCAGGDSQSIYSAGGAGSSGGGSDGGSVPNSNQFMGQQQPGQSQTPNLAGRHFDSAGTPLDGEFYDELYIPTPGTEFDGLSGLVIHVYELTVMEWADRRYANVPTPLGRPLPWFAAQLALDSLIEPSMYVDTYEEYEIWSEGRLSYMVYGNGMMLGRRYRTVVRPTGRTFANPLETLLDASEFFRDRNVLEPGWYRLESDSWEPCILCSRYGN